MNSEPQIAEPVVLFRTLKAPFLSFFAILLALLATPGPVTTLALSGGYTPLVSLFVNGISAGLLPAGWRMIIVSSNEPLEIYVTASVMLALLLSSPMISYQVMKLIAPVETRRKTLYSLVASASALLAAGVIFGYIFLFPLYFASITQLYIPVSVNPPVLDAAEFYFLVFRIVGASAIAFTLPVYVYALIKFRRK